MLKNYDGAVDQVGSWRASVFDKRLAQIIWDRIAPHINRLRLMNEHTPTDWDKSPAWRAVGISPLMRFIRYTSDGLLVPHYDAPYIYHEGKRTLMSLILYLTGNDAAHGGATRFIDDPQASIPVERRSLEDWSELATPDQVLTSISPSVGSILLFDHRLLHDSEPYSGSAEKVIMRTDIVFERCGLATGRELTVSKPLGLPETVASSQIREGL